MKTVLHVAGARPNFMKVAPVFKAIARRGVLQQLVVHTGQHYDEKMSGVFFQDLDMPQPDIHLRVGSGSHAEQTAKAMMALERVLLESKPDLVSLVGDINSTLAGALVTAKLGLRSAHVEAGLRSFDRAMPEEVNRVVTDRLADFLLTPSKDADENLKKEGVEASQVHFVGNVMIDSLLEALPRAQRLPKLDGVTLTPQSYAVCTLHRPSNVDDGEVLRGLVHTLEMLSQRIPIVFPIHPRTRKSLEGYALSPRIFAVDPMGYLEFLALTSHAKLILTDSGGLQEESTALGIPCLTLRDKTERPVTVTEGTNRVVGTKTEVILREAGKVLDGELRHGSLPALWDGHTGERIAKLYESLI